MAGRLAPMLRRGGNLWHLADRFRSLQTAADALSAIQEPRRTPQSSTPEIQSPGSHLPYLSLNYSLQVRHMSGCQLRLGAPPPMKVVVEYPEEDSEALNLFIALANEIESEFPDIVVEGNPEEIQPRENTFEITYGSSTLFSRLQLKRLPKEEEVLATLREEYRPEEEARSISCK